MRFLFFILFFLLVPPIHSQKDTFKKPNYKRIKRNVKKKSSDLNYVVLYKKFTSLHSKMTLEEKRHLYYGFVFQKKYNPFGFSKYHDSLRLYTRKKDLKKNIPKMLVFSEHILSKNPFNIEVLTYKAYLLRKNNDMEAYKITKKQIRIIYDAIKSSGDGLSKKSAFHVIFRNHKSDLLKHKNLKFNGTRKTIDKYRVEYLNVEQNKNKIRGLYFNVSAFKINLKSKR